ncbi:MAG: alanine--tRNA ligase [Candidatus Obscuribacterales bacterium]|nr:alanine--tRNA ligase [Candidatus Obscuribacterales bacterium]
MSLSGAEIRDRFVSFFKDKKGHLHLPSSSLIPDNPTLLLTSAGMVQFVPIFLGNAKPTEPPRVVTVQKCARAGGKDSDIENIGRTTRHHSFFEMLGNFSFGDYFKSEIIPWAWDFVTNDLGLDKERLIVTVFEGNDQVEADQEAYDIWHKVVGVPESRIFRLPAKDNFWGPPGPTGPCGPCSEIYYDRGAEFSKKANPEPGVIDLDDDDRYVEFWNLVFMELSKDESGKFTPLKKKNVDTGSGLDRVAMIIQEKHNTFETDLFFPILEDLVKLSGSKYTGGIIKGAPKTAEEKNDSYLKIICDHARCVSFLIADGVRTSNVGRGYVLRFMIRRAARFGRLLGLEKPFLYKLIGPVVEIYGPAYSELVENKTLIEQAVEAEEERFAKTIDRGMHVLSELLLGDGKELCGREAFNLYATFGFPLELTEEIAIEQGKTVDMQGFEKARLEHEQVSSVSKFNIVITGEETLGDILREHGETDFSGYDSLKGSGTVLAILKDGKPVEQAEESELVEVLLDSTPFYAESGGQLGDHGKFENKDVRLGVLDTKKHEGLHLHRVKVESGQLLRGAVLEAAVDKNRRLSTVSHHSSAHIFHSAVRQLLGKHVVQAGSQVGPQAMRFDFTFERQPTKQEIIEIESLMNRWIQDNALVKTTEMDLDEAKKTGALAMFGEKYGNRVRIVEMGDFSLEFCGGTHVNATGEIGLVKLISEGSISSGTRRIEAYSGQKAWTYILEQMTHLNEASEKLKVKPADLLCQIERLQEQLKEKEKLALLLEEKLALGKAASLIESGKSIGDIRLIAEAVEDISVDALKTLSENIASRQENLVVILGSVQSQDKVSLVCAISKKLVSRGFNAGKIVNEVATACGGKGGGRPELAQAGGKEPGKLTEALSAGSKMVEEIAVSATAQ